MSEYVKMHQFLKEEEQLQLQLLERVERENIKKLRENELKLTQQIRNLSKMVEHIEIACQSSIVETFEVRVAEILIKEKQTVATCQISKHNNFLLNLKN